MSSMRWEDGTRVTTVHSRYHIGTPADGSLRETAQTRAEAFRTANAICNRERVVVTVYDSMARVGAGELWTFEPHPDASVNSNETWKLPTRRRECAPNSPRIGRPMTGT